MAQTNLPERIVLNTDLNGDGSMEFTNDTSCCRKGKRKSRRNKSQPQRDESARIVNSIHESDVSESGSTNGLTDKDTKPLITITFCDARTFDVYRDQFRKFLRTFHELALVVEEEDTAMKMFESRVENESVSETESERKRKWKRKRMENSVESLFVLDTEPANEGEKCPLYKSVFIVEEKTDKRVEIDKRTCFNCGESHDFKDCPLPKDINRINMTRAKLAGKSARYHANNKNSPFRPGVISDRLRRALGLGRHQIPAHVYRMRMFGYPPGWLDEAKVSQSDLALYDGEGKKDQTSRSPKKTSLNTNMIIDYPGFNCSLGKGYKDEYMMHGVQPFTSGLCKENMIAFVNKSLENEAIVEHSQRPKSPSPSLGDLQAQKEKLLAQLTTNEDSSSSSHINEGSKSEPVTPKARKSSVSASSTGTPILKPLSPYSSVPNAGNFSKNISPLSLPVVQQSGKYEQIFAVLEKMRNKLKNPFEST